jgi:hypothetical protein
MSQVDFRFAPSRQSPEPGDAGTVGSMLGELWSAPATAQA